MEIRHPAFAYRDLLFELVRPGTRWLDVGCGRKLIPLWLPNSEADQRALAARCAVLAGVDTYETKHPLLTDFRVAEATALPFPDSSFDLVTTHMVVEHLAEPEAFLDEAGRVLVPDGKLVIVTPNLHYYLTAIASFLPSRLTRKVASFLDERNESDIFPTRYRLNTPRRIERAARGAGLCVVDLRLLNHASALGKIPPLYAIDKLLVRLWNLPMLALFRPNLLAILEKRSPLPMARS